MCTSNYHELSQHLNKPRPRANVAFNAAVEWLVIPPDSYMRADARDVNTSPAKIGTSEEAQSFKEAVENFRSTNEELSVLGAKRLC